MHQILNKCFNAMLSSFRRRRKARGGALVVTERALFAGTEAHVLGGGMRGATVWREYTELLRGRRCEWPRLSVTWHRQPRQLSC